MTPVELTSIAGIVAVVIAGIGLLATGIYRVGRLTEETNRLPLEIHAGFQRIHERLDHNEGLTEERFRRNEEIFEERFRRHEEIFEERFRRNEEIFEERCRRLEEMIRHNEAVILSESERTREQIRNLQQAIMSHSHDEDGNVMFRVPPADFDE